MRISCKNIGFLPKDQKKKKKILTISVAIVGNVVSGISVAQIRKAII